MIQLIPTQVSSSKSLLSYEVWKILNLEQKIATIIIFE